MRVFIDETGDHNLIYIDPQYPLFMLGALLISDKEYEILNQKIEQLKEIYFPSPETFILHSSELKRPANKKCDPRNLIMLNKVLRKKFYKELDQIIQDTNLKVITCLVKKNTFSKMYKYPIDPYHFCFENVLNRIIKHGDTHNKIYAEMRDPHLDINLQSEYERLCKVGIHKYKAGEVRSKKTFNLVSKKDNINGLQLIDLILSCVARSYLGKEKLMLENDICYDPVLRSKIVETTIFPDRRI